MKTQIPDNMMVGKRKQDGSEWHPLVLHCIDVAAFAATWLAQPLVQERLLGGRGKRLSLVQQKMLCFFAAIHDLGKLNAYFQNKIRGLPEKHSVGHSKPALALLGLGGLADDLENLFLYNSFKNNLTIADLATSWFNDTDENLFEIFLKSAFSHHGDPLNLKDFELKHKLCWKDDPSFHTKNIADFLRLIWDTLELDESLDNPHEGFTVTQITNSFGVSFSGLIQASDWGASNTNLFPYLDTTNEDFQANTLEICKARFESSKNIAHQFLKDAGRIDLDLSFIKGVLDRKEFKKILPFTDLNPVQKAVFDAFNPKSGMTELIEAQMGAGKTEMAILRALQYLVNGFGSSIVFALPTKSSAEQIYKRLTTILEQAIPNGCPKVILATGDSIGSYNYQIKSSENKLHMISELDEKSEATIYEENQAKRILAQLWATDSAKKSMSGTIVVCTIDQVEQATLKNTHATMIKFFLDQAILIIDEVHASDDYQMRIVEQVLKNHRSLGGVSILMSATLTESAKKKLLGLKSKDTKTQSEAMNTIYPLLTQVDMGVRTEIALPSSKEKTFHVEILEDLDFEKLAHSTLDSAERGAKICVLKNTVKMARKFQIVLEQIAVATNREHLLFKVAGKIALVHARFTADAKKKIIKELEKRCGKNSDLGGFVVVATQVVQQSLDLDFDRMYTDLCPMDVLLQRAGRVHRHTRARPIGFEDPILVVLSPDDFVKNVKDRYSIGVGAKTVYENLVILGATLKSIKDKPLVKVDAQARERIENTLDRVWGKEFLDSNVATELENATKPSNLGARSLASDACFDIANDSYIDLTFNNENNQTRLGCDDVLVHFKENDKYLRIGDIFGDHFISLSVSLSLLLEKDAGMIDFKNPIIGIADCIASNQKDLVYEISLSNGVNTLKSKLKYSRFGIELV